MNFIKVFIDEVDSTNLEAVRRYENGSLMSGTIIRTAFQTSGKGYEKNYWESEKGKNLLFTVSVKPANIKASEQFMLTQIISLAIVEVLDYIIPEKGVSVKWPNDIYVGDKKIAGILIQNFIKNEDIDISLIGVGLNVNQTVFREETPNPTSLKLETGKEFDLDRIFEKIIERFDYNLCVMPGNSESLKQNYLKRLYRFNEFYDFGIENKKTVRGKIVDISSYGQMILETESGEKLKFNFKEVEFIL